MSSMSRKILKKLYVLKFYLYLTQKLLNVFEIFMTFKLHAFQKLIKTSISLNKFFEE